MSERNYPPKGFLELIGNRYGLSSVERSVLYRGVVPKKNAHLRKDKLIAELYSGSYLHIDALNIITTVSSYLLGLPVFRCMDGLLRDASGKRGSVEMNPKMDQAVQLIIRFLSNYQVEGVDFLIDPAGEFSHHVKRAVVSYAGSIFSTLKARITKQVDAKLSNVSSGVVCTSDSEIIETTTCEVYDLAAGVLNYHFEPAIFDLNEVK